MSNHLAQMKYFHFLPLVLLIACFNPKQEKLVIDKNTLDFIEIRKRVDTVALRLSEEQVERFFSKLDSSVSKSPSKVFAEYQLIRHLKDGTILTDDLSSDIIRLRGGQTYTIGDKEFFKTIWFEQAGLTPHHYEYFPTYEEKGEFAQLIETLSAENLANIKQVLTDNGHAWKDVRGVLFYEGYLSYAQLAAYTAEARGSME